VCAFIQKLLRHFYVNKKGVLYTFGGLANVQFCLLQQSKIVVNNLKTVKVAVKKQSGFVLSVTQCRYKG